METKDWIFVALGVAELILLYQQNNIMKMELSRAGTLPNQERDRPAWFKIYWPLLAMAILCAGSWIPYFLSRPNTTSDIFLGYGRNREKIYMVVRTSGLINSRHDRLMMIARVEDISVDYMTDKQNVRSRTFEMSDPTTSMEITLTPENLARFSAPGFTGIYVLEVPETFPVELVTTVGDAEKLGGRLLGHKDFGSF